MKRARAFVLYAVGASALWAAPAAAQPWGTMSAGAVTPSGPVMVTWECYASLPASGGLLDYLQVVLYADGVPFASEFKQDYFDIELTISGQVQVDRSNRVIMCRANNGWGYWEAFALQDRRRPASTNVVQEDWTYSGPGSWTLWRVLEVIDNYSHAYGYTDAWVQELFEEVPGQNGCNLGVATYQALLSSQGRFQDTYQTSPELAQRCQQSPCSSTFVQTYIIDGFEMSQNVTYSCSGISFGGE